MALNDTTYEQLFHKEALNQLLSVAEKLDKDTVKALRSMKTASRGGSIVMGKITKTYQKSKKAKYTEWGYGRYFSNGGLECLQREVRGCLCKGLYTDIDMANAHCVMIQQYAAKKYNMEMPYLKLYNENRDDVFDELYNSEGLVRDESKQLLCRVLYDGYFPNGLPLYFKEIQTEINALYETIKASGEHKDLLDHIVRLKGKDLPGKMKSPKGSLMALLFQTEESHCLEALVASLRESGCRVDVLAYDGCMVRGEYPEDEMDAILRKAEADIETATGYQIGLKVKPLEPFTDLDVVAKEDSSIKESEWKALYEEMREKWELDHFYYKPADTWAHKNERGDLLHYSYLHAKNAYNTPEWILPPRGESDKPVRFFDEWSQSPNRRIVDRIVAKMPDECAPNEISLFSGYYYETLEPAENTEAIETFKDLVRCIAGDLDETYDYLLKSFARMIQTPLEKSNVCVIISSEKQGTGKDTLMLWLTRIMGNHTAHYSSDDAFWNKYDTQREGAVLCYLEEAGVGANKANSDALKARITEDTSFINPKGVKGYSVPNICSHFMTTNNACPVKLEANDRRFVILNPSDRFWKRGKEDVLFWDNLYSKMKSDEWLSSVGNFLNTIDLAGFNTTRFPSTDTREMIMDAVREPSLEERFLEQASFTDSTCTDLFEMYQDYCKINNYRGKPTVTSFSIAILKHKNLFTKRILDGRSLYSKA